ncbi:MAG: hypothetical protein J7501_14955 [Bdellovibrio sp.]|nr:hypothetical protein [Bdellovibrio sp.]
MTTDRLLLAEALTNFIAAIGLVAYLVQIARNRTRSQLERRLSIFLSSMVAIFVMRGIHYSFGASETVKSVVLFFSALWPFAMVLFIEGLLRRHFHISIKILSFTGALIIGAWALSVKANGAFFASLVGFQVVVLAIVAWVTLKRDPSTLSESENRYINGVGIAAMIAVPLLVSDFRSVFHWEVPRMGALGGLVFAYALLKLSEKRRKRDIGKELAYIFAVDLIGASVFCLIWQDFRSFNVACLLILTLHFFILLLKQLVLQERSQVQDWVLSLVESIQSEKVKDIVDFHGVLTQRLGSQSIYPVTEQDLSGFDIDGLKSLVKGSAVLDLSLLKKANPQSEAGQQMAYLLESHQMNQVHVIGEEPLYMILVNAPAIGNASDYQNEMQILKSFLSLIQRKAHE